MKTSPAFIWLASQSPRRQQLLAQIGVAHQTLLPDDLEDAESLEAVQPGEKPVDYVQRVTRAKLHAARQRWRRRGLAPAPILCADTTVALGRRILGKPANAQEAMSTLSDLSGRTHRVLTAVAVLPSPQLAGSRPLTALSVSQVRFAPLPLAVLEDYVASADPFGKAGAYAIQGPMAGWIEHIEGSHSGIMGLPLYETMQLLRRTHIGLLKRP